MRQDTREDIELEDADMTATRDVATNPSIGHVETVSSTAGVTDIVHTPAANAEPTPEATTQRLPSLTQWVAAQTVAFGWYDSMG